MRSCKSLKHVSLHRSPIRDEGCALLCHAIKGLTNIITVNFSNCGLTHQGALAVAKTIEVGCTLSIPYSSFDTYVLFLHGQPIISVTMPGDWSLQQLLRDQVVTKSCVSQFSLSLKWKIGKWESKLLY